MSDLVTFLQAMPLFSGLAPADLRQLQGIVRKRAMQRGEQIFSEGDPGDGFYCAFAGKIKIYKLSPEGKEKILHILGPGEPFGEVPVFSGEVFPANAEALSRGELLFFPRPAFVDMINRNPQLALRMLAVLSKRLRQFTVQIENLALKEVPGRLAHYLVYLMAEQENHRQVDLTISKGQLASLLGTIPETLSRIFAKLSEDGYLRVDGKLIRILDAEGLHDLAGERPNDRSPEW